MNEKLETLIVPKDLGIFLGSYVDMIGDDSVTFYIIERLINNYHSNNFKDETRIFVNYYMTEISEVITGKREYTIETK